MIYKTLERAKKKQKEHFEKIKALSYANTITEEDRSNLDCYYKVTNAIYDIRETSKGEFEYPENGIYVGSYNVIDDEIS